MDAPVHPQVESSALVSFEGGNFIVPLWRADVRAAADATQPPRRRPRHRGACFAGCGAAQARAQPRRVRVVLGATTSVTYRATRPR